jgi:hypothetical protein
MKRFCVVIILLIIVISATWAQSIAVKTNLLYDATTTINLGLEAAIAPKWTIEFPVNYNPWEFPQQRLKLAPNSKPSDTTFPQYQYEAGGTGSDATKAKTEEVRRKFKHWMIQPEARYWFCEKFNGHFFGVHFLAAGYNIVGIPTLGLGGLYFEKDREVKSQQYIFSSSSADPDNEDYKTMQKYKDYRYEGVAYGGGIAYGYHWILSNRFSIEATLGVGYIYQDYRIYDCPVCGKHEKAAQSGRVAPTKAGLSLIYIIK